LHKNHFTLRIDHKPLEWLATILDAYGRRGKWINMLQDFNFQIVHHLGSMHTNADILSKNPMEGVNDDDFQSEIEDCIWTTGWCE